MEESNIGDHMTPERNPINEPPNENVTLGDSLFQHYPDQKPENLEDNSFLQAIKTGYTNDKFFKLIKEKP